MSTLTGKISITTKIHWRIPFVFYGITSLMLLCFFLVKLDERNSATSLSSVFRAPSSIVGEDSTVVITMSFIGDLMCHVPQIDNARKPDGSFDFNPSFKEITQYLSAADVTMGNLECTFAGSGRPYQGYPAFNAPDAYLWAIKNSGIDFVCTANNHSMDTGEEGLLRTVKKVREAGLQSTGTFLSQRDRDSIRVLDIKGVKVAVLNYTYGTNGAYPDSSRKYMLNVADSALVHNDVLHARATNADVVLVFYHWGIENKQEPVAKQGSMFHWAADAGADLVIGAHPHVLEPLTYFKTASNARLDTGIVAWSLGNFLSNQYWRYTDAGVILTLSLKKNFTTGKISLEQTQYFPTMVNRSNDNSIQQHVVIPAQWCELDSLPAWINAGYQTKLCEGFSDTKVMMVKNSAKPALKSYK
ncbi:MAG TPA: CapA family protein [Bacteroidia bacterium]|jgi:poly-gamma-glutamate synthesis protein (capsule biosynthesis protein)|nr:CapA family protein [Bacteroidia bacterium]